MKKLLLLGLLFFLPSQSEAARYWCSDLRIQGGVVDVSYEVVMTCTFVGSDVRGQTFNIETRALILYADLPAAILTKCTDAVVASSALVPNSSAGTGVTVVRANGLIPSFVRGT